MTTRRAPGPSGISALWSLPAFYTDTTGFLLRLSREFGDVAAFRLGPQRVFLFSHPNDVREILVRQGAAFGKGRSIERARSFLGDGLLTSEGARHLEKRRLLQPAFQRDRLAALTPMIREHTLRMTEEWTPGTTVEIVSAMMHLMMNIVAQALFNSHVEAVAITRELEQIQRVFPVLTLPGASGLEHLPLPAFRRYQRARVRLDEIMMELIRERRGQCEDRGDFLSLLLSGDRATAGGCPAHAVNGGSRLTDTEIRDEMIIAFLAGHETTAIALAWTWYLLSEHPSEEAALHRALDAEEPDLEQARRIFAESMRLYPPIGRIGRRALADVEVGGYFLPKGTIAFVSPWVTQHDPRFFADPFAFDPGRWTPTQESARPRFSYFPFGGGVRQCIGEPLAWTVGLAVVSAIAGRWTLRLEPGHPVDIQTLMTLRPRHGLPMRVEERRPAKSS